MSAPSRLNKYTRAVLHECQPWLETVGASYRCFSAEPPTVIWDFPRHGTRRGRQWRIEFGCNEHDLTGWHVRLMEQDHRGNIYAARDEVCSRGALNSTAQRLLEHGLEHRHVPTRRCGHHVKHGIRGWLRRTLS